jgi:hypothetical protein
MPPQTLNEVDEDLKMEEEEEQGDGQYEDGVPEDRDFVFHEAPRCRDTLATVMEGAEMDFAPWGGGGSWQESTAPSREPPSVRDLWDRVNEGETCMMELTNMVSAVSREISALRQEQGSSAQLLRAEQAGRSNALEQVSERLRVAEESIVGMQASSPDATPLPWLQEVEGGPMTGRIAEDLLRENDCVKGRIGDVESGMQALKLLVTDVVHRLAAVESNVAAVGTTVETSKLDADMQRQAFRETEDRITELHNALNSDRESALRRLQEVEQSLAATKASLNSVETGFQKKVEDCANQHAVVLKDVLFMKELVAGEGRVIPCDSLLEGRARANSDLSKVELDRSTKLSKSLDFLGSEFLPKATTSEANSGVQPSPRPTLRKEITTMKLTDLISHWSAEVQTPTKAPAPAPPYTAPSSPSIRNRPVMSDREWRNPANRLSPRRGPDVPGTMSHGALFRVSRGFPSCAKVEDARSELRAAAKMEDTPREQADEATAQRSFTFPAGHTPPVIRRAAASVKGPANPMRCGSSPTSVPRSLTTTSGSSLATAPLRT